MQRGVKLPRVAARGQQEKHVADRRLEIATGNQIHIQYGNVVFDLARLAVEPQPIYAMYRRVDDFLVWTWVAGRDRSVIVS